VASASSLRRIAQLAHKMERDLKSGGLAYPWKSLFRTNAMLIRLVAHLAEHLASTAESEESRTRRPRPRRERFAVEADPR
jgi:HPt (histidine-containing phosphotransfer) domain-containing protein